MNAAELTEKIKAAEAVREILVDQLDHNEKLIKDLRVQLRYEIKSRFKEWMLHEGINILSFGNYGAVVKVEDGKIMSIKISKPKIIQ